MSLTKPNASGRCVGVLPGVPRGDGSRQFHLLPPIALLPLALYPISWLLWVGLLFAVLVYISPLCGVDGVGWALEGRLLK
jgi:hypothetical protein